MITFRVESLTTGYNDYKQMYERAKGSLKGILKFDTFQIKLRSGKRIKLPNAKFVYDNI